MDVLGSVVAGLDVAELLGGGAVTEVACLGIDFRRAVNEQNRAYNNDHKYGYGESHLVLPTSRTHSNQGFSRPADTAPRVPRLALRDRPVGGRANDQSSGWLRRIRPTAEEDGGT